MADTKTIKVPVGSSRLEFEERDAVQAEYKFELGEWKPSMTTEEVKRALAEKAEKGS